MKKTIDLEKLKLIDLTYTLEPGIPQWSMGCGFQQEIVKDYADYASEVKFRVHKITMPAGRGTHMDAPAHCIAGGNCISDISLNQLVVPCVMIDITSKAHEYYSLTPLDINEFESCYGTIEKGALVIVRTGWDRFWSQPEKYRNNLVFPSVSKEAAELLLQREVSGLGIDTLSPDREADGFPVHQLFLSAGKYLVENVANSSQLSAVGAYAVVLPIKIKTTEAPIRIIGMIPG